MPVITLGAKKVTEQFQAVTGLANTFVVNSDKAVATSALARLKFVENSLKAISSTNEKILEGIKEVAGMLEEYRQSLAKLVDNAKEIDELTLEMTESAAAINKGSGAMKSDLLADQKRLEAESDDTIGETERLILILAAGGFLLGCAWAFLLDRGFSRPMTAMCNAMRKLAAGDFEVVLPGLGRSDELGEMASAVEEFKVQAIARAERDAATQEAQNKAASAARRAELIRFADEFETAVGAIVANVSSSAVQLETAAGTLTRTAETTQSLSSQVAGASEEASTNMQSVASATEELVGVRRRDRAARQGKQPDCGSRRPSGRTDRRADRQAVARRAGDRRRRQADHGDCRADQSPGAERHHRGGARGDAGRGFAVVASEVKSLASQTAKATDEISNHISGMQGATQESVAAIKEIGGTIGKISDIAATIASAVERRSRRRRNSRAASRTSRKGTQEAAANVMHVDRGATRTRRGIRGGARFRAHAVERKRAARAESSTASWRISGRLEGSHSS